MAIVPQTIDAQPTVPDTLPERWIAAKDAIATLYSEKWEIEKRIKDTEAIKEQLQRELVASAANEYKRVFAVSGNRVVIAEKHNGVFVYPLEHDV